MKRDRLEDYITTIEDFPAEGIMFRDVTTLIQDPDGLAESIDGLCKSLEGIDFDVVMGLEARGFIFGTPVACNMNKGFVPIRKKGKLPRETVSASYSLEYGVAEIEIHKDAIKKGDRVVIIDDLIATGGSLEAACSLVEQLGGEVVMISVVMELEGLKGKEKLGEYPFNSLIKYPGK